MVLGNSIHTNDFKRGARIYRFLLFFFHLRSSGFTHVIWTWGKLVFCCCFGTYLWQRSFPSVVLGVFHQQLSSVPVASIFCSLNGNIAAYVYMLFLGFPLAAAGVSLLLSCSHFLCLWCLYLSGSSLATGSLWTVSMWIKGFDYKFVPVLTHPVTWWWSVKFAVINALLDCNVCGRLPENKPCQKHAGVMFGTPVFLVWKSFQGIARTSMRDDLHSCGVGWIASFS